MSSDPTSVAIACQGGGSHTAYTAGVLDGICTDFPSDYRIIGFSGTSGGAITGTVAWDALRTDGPAAIGDRVLSLWADIAAGDPFSRTVNTVGVWLSSLQEAGVALPSVSPYANPAAWTGRSTLRTIIEANVDFGRPAAPDDPQLYVSTIDVLSGAFRTFDETTVTPRVLLASAAVPEVFPAVDLDGVPHWDGLFARNPPISDFLTEPDDVGEKPDEIWIVQVNPPRRSSEPRSQSAIADRRSELSGSISLGEQVSFVERVSAWVDRGWLPQDRYKSVDVRPITLTEELSLTSRLDRDPELIGDLIRWGRQDGTEFRRNLS